MTDTGWGVDPRYHLLMAYRNLPRLVPHLEMRLQQMYGEKNPALKVGSNRSVSRNLGNLKGIVNNLIVNSMAHVRKEIHEFKHSKKKSVRS